MKNKNDYKWFRRVAMAEGISFLLLLLVAMPLKYMAGLPLAVTIVGAIHGILFIAFIILAWEIRSAYKHSWTWFGKAFLASIIPFGTFYMDKQWRKESI